MAIYGFIIMTSIWYSDAVVIDTCITAIYYALCIVTLTRHYWCEQINYVHLNEICATEWK